MQAARIIRHVKWGRRGFHDHLPRTTMNDLPQPKGAWQEAYDRNQQRYNMHLLAGLLTFGGTLAFGQYFGFHRMYNDIPTEPAVVETYKVEED